MTEATHHTAVAPPARQFPAYPVSWYLFGPSRELGSQPISRNLLGRRLAAFRTGRGQVSVLDARCSHLGADLGQGRVVGAALRCPFHGWEYGADGRCTHIPVSDAIPPSACQTAYPAIERHGLVFFFNGRAPLFPLPFFAGAAAEDFIPAEPFAAVLRCPWYMVGANAFDVQHFRGAHDRRLLRPPLVDCPSPFARRITASFAVQGRSPRDRLTRWFGGGEVEMSFTDWCGNLIFATATFRRTKSHGMVLVRPLAADRVLVQVVVFVRRSSRWLGQRLLDPVHLWIRRSFIQQFLQSDAELGALGIRYNPHGLISCDQELVDYFQWLANISEATRRKGPEHGTTSGRCADVGQALQPDTSHSSVRPGRLESLTCEKVQAPPAEDFPVYPISWYLFGTTDELRGGPVSKDLLGRRLVGFRTDRGQVAVLDARCSHLQADLGRGRVIGAALQCPFHNWEYGTDGRCTHIPSSPAIPAFARQTSYPVAVRHGLIFFFHGRQPLFPLPFFPGADADDFVRAEPFEAVLRCPWYMVGANAFDLQHFSAAHDRRVVGAPSVACSTPFARSASALFAVLGNSARDRLTRWFGGNQVELAITDWCGNLMFVTATFRRTKSYGMLATHPLGTRKVLVRVVVFLPRSAAWLGRLLLDSLQLRIKRYFIKEFLRADARLAMRGFHYNPQGLLDYDRELAQYFQWLASAAATARAMQEQGW